MSTQRQRYSRVPADDAGDGSNVGSGPRTGAAAAAASRKELVETISNKMHAAVWVGGTLFVMYYTDFVYMAWGDDRVNRTALDVCLLCNGAFMAIGFYLVVWLDYIKQNKYKWEVVAPRMVPTATAFGVAGVISFIFAFWPVWGLLTIPITALFMMGLLFSAHFIPMP